MNLNVPLNEAASKNLTVQFAYITSKLCNGATLRNKFTGDAVCVGYGVTEYAALQDALVKYNNAPMQTPGASEQANTVLAAKIAELEAKLADAPKAGKPGNSSNPGNLGFR